MLSSGVFELVDRPGSSDRFHDTDHARRGPAPHRFRSRANGSVQPGYGGFSLRTSNGLAGAGFDPTEDVESLRRRGLGDHSTVVDIGCGAGTFVLAVAPHCRRVIAVDVSGVMLGEVARRVKQNAIANVETVQAGFLTYEHSGVPADVVFTRNALHHLPDFWRALALTRLASIMAPAGVLWLRDLVYSHEPVDAGAALERWFDGATEDSKTAYTHEELVEHVRAENSTFSWLLEPLITHAGLRIVGCEVDPSRTYARYECVKVTST
jgi:2-polyprenyl-3-methyl-5-hydroxy-6-metoxy-1,4-benzoquinol methylase